MSDSLKDLLNQRKFSEPEEVRIIKEFVKDNFASDCGVSVNTRLITISVASASLAGALRMRLHELQKLCPGSRRLSIRISG